jgi:hypothetical protein
MRSAVLLTSDDDLCVWIKSFTFSDANPKKVIPHSAPNTRLLINVLEYIQTGSAIDWDYAEKVVYVNYSPRWARWCLFFN